MARAEVLGRGAPATRRETPIVGRFVRDEEAVGRRAAGSPDWALIATVLALTLLGLVFVFSSSFAVGQELFGDPHHFAIRQLQGGGAGGARVPGAGAAGLPAAAGVQSAVHDRGGGGADGGAGAGHRHRAERGPALDPDWLGAGGAAVGVREAGGRDLCRGLAGQPRRRHSARHPGAGAVLADRGLPRLPADGRAGPGHRHRDHDDRRHHVLRRRGGDPAHPDAGRAGRGRAVRHRRDRGLRPQSIHAVRVGGIGPRRRAASRCCSC